VVSWEDDVGRHALLCRAFAVKASSSVMVPMC
jgi:hypothetical protein